MHHSVAYSKFEKSTIIACAFTVWWIHT